ncbi:MAG: hypothetical protein KC468_16125, partial [Myxococcales bacterium]|nr:hypothetical protein [Myxococcales bacterium]
PAPSTRPAGGELMEVAPSRCDWDGTVKFALGHGVQVAANGLLVFESVSPDRSWTALAPGDRWRGLEPRCVAHQLGEREIRARFAAEGEAALVVRVDEATATMSIDATTRLPEPVYSHLNHAFQATLTGNDLWITAAPCPEQPWQPLSREGPGDFAYIDADGRFVLARTSSEEKGPFEERCRGTAPQGPVELWVHAGDRLAGRILLHDWATQADRSPSPTAGWGVSANAIEVWRASPTSLHLSASLSVTSIGRGWHAVGHAAGTYRSRVELVALP